jgi:hypothetical protein
MATKNKFNTARLFQKHPILTPDAWAHAIGGRNARTRVVAQAKYYAETGRLRRLTRGLYAVVPIGTEPRTCRSVE